MINWGAAVLTLMVMSAPGEGALSPMLVTTATTQVVIREQIIIRMPGPAGARNRTLIEWKESTGPKCVPARAIAGARLRGRNRVDLILKNRRRLRASLASSCPALDFYNGFYITPNPDGMICTDRDAIRSRMGGECGIDEFNLLHPVRKD